MGIRHGVHYDLFTDKVTSGTGGKAIFSADFRHIKITVASGATPALTATVKVYGSTTEKGEDIDFTLPASATNLYDTLQLIDNSLGTGPAGDTGIVFSASTNEVRNYAVNIDNFSWIGVDVTSIGVPAYLTGGTAATAIVGTWTAVSDGEFAITIDGTAYDVEAIDFSSGVASMANVATKIQTALRAETSGSETVVWSTDHFIVTSGNVDGVSAITVTSAVSGGSGTDISGVGATTFMDSEATKGTVTATVVGTITGQVLLTNNQ